MLNNIKNEIKSIIDDVEDLRDDIDYYEDAETTEDMDFREWYRTFMNIIGKLEKIIKED